MLPSPESHLLFHNFRGSSLPLIKMLFKVSISTLLNHMDDCLKGEVEGRCQNIICFIVPPMSCSLTPFTGKCYLGWIHIEEFNTFLDH